jgi:hypothetical protein
MAASESILLELESQEEARFWAKVQKLRPDQCWPWIAKSKAHGYGLWRVRKKLYRAHRVAYILGNGKVLGPLDALHSCHVRSCCNPAHLSPGTHLQNMQQMVAAGRHWRKGTAKPKVYRPHRPTKPIPELTGPDEDRFWSYVDKGAPDECWLWIGATRKNQFADGRGYGVLRISGKTVDTHKISYALANGYGHGLFVLHECDEPWCVNPQHLVGGTQRKNLEDMYARGRGRKARGASAGKAKLQPEDVIAIRERLNSGEKNIVLAKEFGVHSATIGDIKYQRSWKHL